MVHDGLEMSNDYISMSAGIVQNERPTTRSYLSLAVARVGMPLGDGKASVLDKQARLVEHITTQEDEAPSLSVEDVLGSLLAHRQNSQRQNNTRFRWSWS